VNLFDAIRSRRSVRRFKDRPVPYDLLGKILEAGCSAPSACNRQLWEFVVVSKTETKNRIADEACYGQLFIKQAPVLVVVFYDDTKERREEDTPRKHDAIQSAAAALQNMFLAAHALGIGALWICGIRHMLKLNDILEVPRNIRPIAIMAFGYPDEVPVEPRKRPAEAFIHYERFHGIRSSYPNSIDPRAWSLEELAVFRGRICWYSGTFLGSNVLEKYAAGTFTYNALIRWAASHINSGCRMMDFLPYGGGYLMGLLRIPIHPGELFVWEMDVGNEKFIRQNFDIAHLSPPTFIISVTPDSDASPRSLDCITCFFRLERVPDAGPWIQMMYDSLRPGGKLLLAFETPNWLGTFRLFKGKRLRNLHTSPLWCTGPARPIREKAVRAALALSGFHLIEQKRLQNRWILKTIIKRIFKDQKPSILIVAQKPMVRKTVLSVG